MLHDEVAFFVERARFQAVHGEGGVGRADDDTAVPGHGEEDATVGGLGHHDGSVAGQEFLGEDEVDALADGNDVLGGRVVHATYPVNEYTGGVDDGTGADGEAAPRLFVAHFDAGNGAGLFDDAGDAAIVEDDGSEVFGSLGEVDGEAGIVELAVVVDDAADEVFLFHGGEPFNGFLAAEHARGGEAEFAGELVVNFHADAVEGAFPPRVVGNDEGLVMHEMRGVAREASAFAEGFEDEGDVALFEVTHAAVHEFGGTAGGAFGKIRLFEEGHAVAA